MKAMFGSILAAICIFAAPASAQECTTIQDGAITNKYGEAITTGYDEWGYNYAAHMFNGTYCDAYRTTAYCDVELIMKWNDAWISDKDCNGDGRLDWVSDPGRTTKGSGAWLTNHQSGWVEVNGKMKKWTYFTKIVAVPADAVRCTAMPAVWCQADGTTIIGPAIWGDFATVETVSNDPSAGEHGLIYKSAVDPGLGNLN